MSILDDTPPPPEEPVEFPPRPPEKLPSPGPVIEPEYEGIVFGPDETGLTIPKEGTP